MKICTKNVHFTYNYRVYQINDKVGIGLTLQIVLSRIFMVEFEYIVR